MINFMVNIFFTFCAFFRSFISNANTVITNFRANLDAQSAGNGITAGFKFQNFSEGVRPQTPLFMRGMSATRGFQSLLSLSNISSHR